MLLFLHPLIVAIPLFSIQIPSHPVTNGKDKAGNANKCPFLNYNEESAAKPTSRVAHKQIRNASASDG